MQNSDGSISPHRPEELRDPRGGNKFWSSTACAGSGGNFSESRSQDATTEHLRGLRKSVNCHALTGVWGIQRPGATNGGTFYGTTSSGKNGTRLEPVVP